MYKSRHVDSVDKYYKGALRELLIYEERLGLISKAKNPVTRKLILTYSELCSMNGIIHLIF